MAIHFLNDFSKQVLGKISAKWQPNSFWRIPDEAYTLEHKLAFLEREHYLTGRYSLSGWLHDCDKLLLYAVPWLNEKQIQRIHRRHQSHHVDYPQSKVQQLVQMYIDWDCAALTKPDKPLNAFATLIHFYRNKLPLMLPVCLAIDPDSVQPAIADLDEARKKDNANYLFGQQMNDDIGCDLTEYAHDLLVDKLEPDSKNDVVYIQATRLIGNIVHDLNKIIEDMDTTGKPLDYIIQQIPQNLSLMKPVGLFLKTLDWLAKSRNQKINLNKCVELFREKNLYFKQMAPRFRAEAVKSEFMHNYRTVMIHPFLDD